MPLRLISAHPVLRRLLVARLVSEAGTWIAYVALTVAVYDATKSPVWVSAVLLAGFVPAAALAPVIGRIVDRVPRESARIPGKR